MGVFDGEIFRITAQTKDRYGNTREIVRYVDDEATVGRTVGPLKGAQRAYGERTVALRVDRLTFVVDPVSEYDFGEEWR